MVKEEPAEYQGIYRRFDALLNARQSEVDDAPFRLVADAFMIGQAGAGGRVRGLDQAVIPGDAQRSPGS